MASVRGFVRKVADAVARPYVERLAEEGRRLAGVQRVDAGTQVLLRLAYQHMLGRGAALPTLCDVGFRAYSQFDEDGILLFIFAIIGTTNRLCVEIGAGDGVECNTANLLINHGWSGLLIDGNEDNVRMAVAFYRDCPDTYLAPPRCVRAWVDRDNVNELVSGNGFSGDIDLLSLDLDGVDYWVWEALGAVRPRVVVLEYQALWRDERCVTVPYRPDFISDQRFYNGASLPAFVKLGRRKGYRLVGANRFGFNAFFVRDGVGEEVLPEVAPHLCFSPLLDSLCEEFAREAARQVWVEV